MHIVLCLDDLLFTPDNLTPKQTVAHALAGRLLLLLFSFKLLRQRTRKRKALYSSTLLLINNPLLCPPPFLSQPGHAKGRDEQS